MQQLNRIINLLSEDVLNGTGDKATKVLLRYVFLAFLFCIIIFISIALSASILLLLQSYFIGHISYQNLIFDGLGVSQEIREFNYRCLWLIGFLLLAISPLLKWITTAMVTSYKYSYVSFIAGILIILWSLYLGISQNFITFNSGEDISRVMIFIGIAGNIFTSIEERYANFKKFFSLITMMSLFIYACYMQ